MDKSGDRKAVRGYPPLRLHERRAEGAVEGAQWVWGLAFSPDSKQADLGQWSGHQRHHLGRGECCCTGSKAIVRKSYAVGITPDGQRAVTGGNDDTLRLWSVADGVLLKKMIGHGDKVYSLAVSPKDGGIASGDRSGEIRLWDGKTGALKKVLANQGGHVGSLRFSPDGRLLLSACAASGCKAQRIYDVASGKELTAYAMHDNAVTASAFSPDGSLVATGGGENEAIHIWDPRTGETKAVLKGTGSPGWAVGFSADGRGIAWGNQVMTAM